MESIYCHQTFQVLSTEGLCSGGSMSGSSIITRLFLTKLCKTKSTAYLRHRITPTRHAELKDVRPKEAGTFSYGQLNSSRNQT